MKFNNPITIGKRHDISFFPKEGTIRTFELEKESERNAEERDFTISNLLKVFMA